MDAQSLFNKAEAKKETKTKNLSPLAMTLMINH